MAKILATPAKVTAAARTARLGESRQVFRYGGRISEWFAWSFLLFTATTCWADATKASYDLHTSRAFAVGVAVAVSAVVIAQFVQLRLRRAKRVYVYDHGLVTANGFRRVTNVIRWEDVAVLRQKYRNDIYLPSMEGPLIDGSNRAWLTLKSGKRVRFAGSIKDAGQLMIALYRPIGAVQLPALIKQWEGLGPTEMLIASGYQLSSTGIVVQHRGWPRRQTFIRWSDVRSVNVTAPLAPSFYRYPGGSTTLSLNGQPNPSATVLLFGHIIAQRSKAAPERAAPS